MQSKYQLSMLFQQRIPEIPFTVWLIRDRENKILFVFALLAMTILFSWLKVLYPYPNFMPPDSNSYLEAAFYNQLINVWAIGYSKFLRLISCFTKSHFILILIQYTLLMGSLLYFLFSVRYFFSFSKWSFRFLLAFTLANPLFVQIANFVSSDCLFLSLSIIWFIQLFWIIYNPKKSLFISHAIILLLAFTVRHNALYFPFISIIIISLSKISKKKKLVAIGLCAGLVSSFVGRTQMEYFEKTGTVQYSAFGGWQIAANALYGYAFAKPDPVESVPYKFRNLHKMVNSHMDSLRKLMTRPDEEVAVYYLWDFKSPLRVYMAEQQKSDSTSDFFKRWASMAPLYSEYGKFLIMKHPIAFIRFYVWPNFIKYYSPPTKFMGMYNMGEETVAPITVSWFKLPNNKISNFHKDKKIKITEAFPIIIPVTNLVFVLSFIAFALLNGFKQCNPYRKRFLWCVLIIWFSNMAFSVLSAPIELRYQLFPMTITICFTWILTTFIIEQIRLKESSSNVYDSTPQLLPNSLNQL